MTKEQKRECKAAYKYEHQYDEPASFTIYVDGVKNVKKAEKICHKNNSCYVRIYNDNRYVGQIEPVTDDLATISYIGTIADMRFIIEWLRKHYFYGNIGIYKSVYIGSFCDEKRVSALNL